MPLGPSQTTCWWSKRSTWRLRLQPDWPGPDITHGRAGLGLTLLHFHQVVGDGRLLAAAGRCADSLLGDVERNASGTIGWRTPTGFRSSFSGRTFYGFAHGTAGIATFLLAMAQASGREDCRRVVSDAADFARRVLCPSRRPDRLGRRAGTASGPVAALVQRRIRAWVLLAPLVQGEQQSTRSFP